MEAESGPSVGNPSPSLASDEAERPSFDFSAHAQGALSTYLKRRDFYGEYASVVERIILQALAAENIKVHSVQSRSKDPESFERKAAVPSESDAHAPKYRDPLKQITDLAGVRVITYFPKTIEEIDAVIYAQFDVIERSDKGALLLEEERFGYQSIHYLVKLKDQRTDLPEYGQFSDAVAEVQVRTILQHAWAEIEHDIQYKSALVIPSAIRRRFMSLAGLLELADREFQSIQDADREIAVEARKNIDLDNLSNVEITPDALRAYLDRRLGIDRRMADWSYDYQARLLRALGFKTLRQVDTCIQGYDDDQISRVAEGSRVGQISRFDHVLLAGMGEKYIQRHFWVSHDWFTSHRHRVLEKLRNAGISIRDYDPLTCA